MLHRNTPVWFMSFYQVMDMLDQENPQQKKLMLELIKLQDHLLSVPSYKLHAHQHDIEDLLVAMKVMIRTILSANQAEGIESIEQFERTVRALPLFRKSYWRTLAKAVGCILLAALGAVLGALVGAAIEGALMTAFSLPIGGIGGIFGVVSGLVHGSITGWAVGLMAASALGIAGGMASGVFFIRNKDQVDHLVDAAKMIVVNHRRL